MDEKSSKSNHQVQIPTYTIKVEVSYDENYNKIACSWEKEYNIYILELYIQPRSVWW